MLIVFAAVFAFPVVIRNHDGNQKDEHDDAEG